MTGRQRALVPLALAVAVAVGAFALVGGRPGGPDGSAGTSAGAGSSAGPGSGSGGPPGPEPSPTPRPPLGGTELYGFLPYWLMNGAVAEHLRSTPVTTLALFSVAARPNGQLNTNPSGYRRITGDIGRRLIREAHDRGARVELVFSSFGPIRNGRFFGRLPGPTPSSAPGASGAPAASPGATAAPAGSPPAPPPWQRTVRELVALAVDLGVDGINVDVERLEPVDRTAYGEFLVALRAALRAELPDAQLSVATEAGERGIANAGTAAAAGVDRVFLMGYEYHWSGSPPGASSPVDRLDGTMTLRWSIERYVEAGVPRDRILLGLPLYGMRWRTTGPDRFFPVIGSGIPWLPSENVDVLTDPDFDSTHDPIEHAEWFGVEDGDDWLITYFDTPATLRSKLALARDQGLAGGGFWALGYTRGLPAYGDLMHDFLDGEVGRQEAPPPYP